MTTSVLLLAQLLLPGLALSLLLRLPGPRFLHAIGLSLSLFVLLYVGARTAHWSSATFSFTYLGASGLLVIVALYRAWRKNNRTQAALVQQISSSKPAYVAPVLLLSVVCIWLASVGPYVEIPSDALAHLKHMQLLNQAWPLDPGTTLPPEIRWMNSHVWYDFVVYILRLSHTSVNTASRWLHLITIPVFLLGVYCFATYLYAGENRHTSKQTIVFAALSSVFVALHMGVNIFSFIRYYALAPTMINLVVYFAAMSLVLDTLRRASLSFHHLLVISVYFATMLLVHTQEALFMAVMSLLLAVYYSFIAATSSQRIDAARGAISIGQRLIAIITGAALLAVTLAWYYIHNTKGFSTSYLPHVQQITAFGNEKYFILNPANNFYQAITHWGLAVYLLFILYFRSFLNQPYLLMGMLSPIFTVFNPLFIDLFLRFYSDTTLWRFAYLVPLHFSAAHIIITAGKDLSTQRLGKRVLAVTSIGVIFVLLTPLNITNHPLLLNRYKTLQSVDIDNSPVYLSDLLAYLDGLQQKESILTDPISAYVISALTGHHAPSHKFFPLHDYKLNEEKYVAADFRSDKSRLLVINKRNGKLSDTGRISHHWYADALFTDKYYSPELLLYIEEHPRQFHMLWRKNGISVYRIQ